MKSLQPSFHALFRPTVCRAMASVSGSRQAHHAASDIVPTPEEKPVDTFYHKDLIVDRASPLQMQPKPSSKEILKFGHIFSDHMMEVDWSENNGWERPSLCPLHNISLHPGAKVLHYAIELFEGMKAYRGIDDRIRLFRPEKNMERMKRTAIRSSLPDFDAEELIKIICELVRLDKEWVPFSETSSLYLRPTMIGTDPTLGVAHPRNAKLFVVSGPVGSFFHQTSFQPITVFADPRVVRAFPGGVGAFKMGCNYAPTLSISKAANDFGCHQVLWLSGPEEKLTEVGVMNIFIYWRNEQGEEELVTPPLTEGLILPGVMRDSVIALAREWNNFRVSERYPTMAEIRRALAEGRLLQMFGSGTACAVSPVGRIISVDASGKLEEMIVPSMDSEVKVMQRFYEAITDIQYGRVARPDWTRVIE